MVTAPGAQGYDANYSRGQSGADALHDLQRREDWLENRIHAATDTRSLSHHQAREALAELDSIRRSQADMRRSDGRFSRSEEREVRDRLDRVSASVGVAQDGYSPG